MKELSEIIKAYDLSLEQGKQCALATVVLVEGSSYRRAGARMLVTEEGELTGAISGGCLEGDALRKAQLVMSRKKSMVVTYDTMDDDDAKLGVGLGCNGIIHILIEPLDASNPLNAVELLKTYYSKRQIGVLVTLFCLNDKHTEQPGTCLLLEEDGNMQLKKRLPFEADLIKDAKNTLSIKRSQVKHYQKSKEYTAFFELLNPPVALVIAGAGNDSIPLMHMAYVLGWNITIVDGRTNYATKQRFPQAKNLIVGKPEQVLPQLTMDHSTAVVLMTHNYNYDLKMLEGLITSEVRYIGILGPKKKLQRMFDELHENGIELNENIINRIYGPTGLDIGAETAEEIALSILSEIKAVFSSQKVISLREKVTSIHLREDWKLSSF